METTRCHCEAGHRPFLRGTDFIGRAVEFDTRDSGTKEAPVIYKATPGASIRLSGGRDRPEGHFTQMEFPQRKLRLRPGVDLLLHRSQPTDFRGHVDELAFDAEWFAVEGDF